MAPRLTPETRADRAMSEKTLQSRVIGRAKRQGWRVAHAGRGWVGDLETGIGGWKTPMMLGWPDLCLIKPGNRLIFCELKRELGPVAPEQLDLLALLNQTGNRAVILRPSDLRSGVVKAILAEGSPLCQHEPS